MYKPAGSTKVTSIKPGEDDDDDVKVAAIVVPIVLIILIAAFLVVCLCYSKKNQCCCWAVYETKEQDAEILYDLGNADSKVDMEVTKNENRELELVPRDEDHTAIQDEKINLFGVNMSQSDAKKIDGEEHKIEEEIPSYREAQLKADNIPLQGAAAIAGGFIDSAA